jgi:two-component system, sensor histidine kinase SagS
MSETQSTQTPPQFSGKVLLVEDNKSNQIVTGFLIEEYGVSFDIANNGQEAVDLISAGKQYDLILMDIHMPIMDGFVATRAIRAYSTTPQTICALSGSNSEDDFSKAKKSGMNDFMVKPIEPEKLEKLFSKYLR